MGISLLSLLVSGWGYVFAAAFCPHSASRNFTAKSEAPSCHQMSEEQAGHSESHSQAMEGMQMLPETQPERQFKAIPVGQLSGTCLHCVGQEKSPVTSATVRELNFQNHDTGASLETSPLPEFALTTLFSPQFVPMQNAPHGTANRKHLLLGIFLI